MSEKSISTEEIWELLSVKLRNFLLKRVSDERVADDLLQETFIRIHKKLHHLDNAQRITPWVFQIARNLVIDHYRSMSREPTYGEDLLDVSVDVEGSNLNELVSGWISQMVSKLPESYRYAVELYELKGISQRTIADHLGISLSGAKSRIQRGRAKLKSMLLECCTFQKDRRGNVIGYVRNKSENCNRDLDKTCDC